MHQMHTLVQKIKLHVLPIYFCHIVQYSLKQELFRMILAATWKHVWLTLKTIEELEYFTNVEQLEQSEKDFSYEILRKVRCEHIKIHQRKKN